MIFPWYSRTYISWWMMNQCIFSISQTKLTKKSCLWLVTWYLVCIRSISSSRPSVWIAPWLKCLLRTFQNSFGHNAGNLVKNVTIRISITPPSSSLWPPTPPHHIMFSWNFSQEWILFPHTLFYVLFRIIAHCWVLRRLWIINCRATDWSNHIESPRLGGCRT